MKNLKTVLVCLTTLAVIATCCLLASPLSARAAKVSPAANPQQKKTVPASKVEPVPANWITLPDPKKNYSFSMPEGSSNFIKNSDGIDVFIAVTPEPNNVGVFVLSLKDPKLTKNDLVEVASGFLKGAGAKNIRIGNLEELSADYSLGTYSAVDEKLGVFKGKLLVATDVTNKYLMFIQVVEAKYKANEKIIDEIWGSFSLNHSSARTEAKASPAANPQQKKTVPASRVTPVPANWIRLTDKKKGYSFSVPEGSDQHIENSDGNDVFIANTPEPTAVTVFVLAFKDPKLTKNDLMKFASGFLEGLGAKNIKIGNLEELSADYSLGTFSAVDPKGGVTKGKVLVATDVTDNYVMLLGADEAEYKANEKIIDEIWGSFSMRSGGASGKS